jgi:hypothetical protein
MHSARRYSVASAISYRNVRRISQKDLNLHSHKMAMVQELSDRDMANRSRVVERLIGILPDDVIILTIDEAHFTSLAAATNRIFAVGQRQIHSSSINDLFTVHV